MKVAMVGSRKWDDWQKIQKVIERLNNTNFDTPLTIISGGSRKGADKMVRWSMINLENFKSIPYVEYAPKFHEYNEHCAHDKEYYGEEYNVKHYFNRNTEIAESCDILFAFVPEYEMQDGGKARGVKDVLDKAKKLNKKTKIIT